MNGSGPSAQPDLATEVTVPLGITNQPRVLVRNINENEAVFHLNGVEMAFANSVRRVIMADVPTVSECCSASRPDWYGLRWDVISFWDTTGKGVGVDERSCKSATC
jgi:hypothetical protein